MQTFGTKLTSQFSIVIHPEIAVVKVAFAVFAAPAQVVQCLSGLAFSLNLRQCFQVHETEFGVDETEV